MLKFNKPATIQASYSATGEVAKVIIVDYDYINRLYLVRYDDGYKEWLPDAAFTSI